MQTDKIHNFGQMMRVLSKRYRQAPDAQVLNGFWQLLQYFGLTPILQALQTYQQQLYGKKNYPTPMKLLHLLVEQAVQKQIQAHDNIDHIASIGDHAHNISQRLILHLLKLQEAPNAY
ncbi:MAG: hypothetical protein V3V61_00595 [Gammaproteobacteria bacterium]